MATHVGASRTPQEVMEHYVTMYIHGNLGKACIPDSIPNRVTDHTCPGGGPLSPSLTTPLPPLDVSLAEQQQLGYMPLRDDYEAEYDQDAEKLISGLSVNYDDEDVDTEMKRAHVDMYVRKLRERQRRKSVARDYSLVPAFLGRDKKDKERPGAAGGGGGGAAAVVAMAAAAAAAAVVGGGGAGAPGGAAGTAGAGLVATTALGSASSGVVAAAGPGGVGGGVAGGGGVSATPATPKRKITKEEKEQRVRLRVLCQFMAHREFEEFFDNAHKERALRAKVRELQRYRRSGVTRLDESAEYEAARHKREKRKENVKGVSSKRGGGALAGGGAGGGGGGGGVAPGSGGVPGTGAGIGVGGGGVAGIKEEGKDGEFAAMETLGGFELLSEREKVLCSSLSLSPARYLTVKTIIIKDHLQKRQGIPAKSRLPGYLDKVLRKRILSFLTESGWISRDAS
ncbi:hypothetical protein NHX12_013971 [Muraenolepis orangiensis]|uniref:SANT domain-containing protein n=1 Tax=Muraenolepis orangiensis TaxID=630683 RepID=A0A9Q0I4S1_9TELE|nr:hypothetical protein NHX12_013971 [Muraenolepis orangiensis]